MKRRLSPGGIWRVLKGAFKGFSANRVMRLSGALAFYTVFSMGPLVVLIVSLCSIYFGKEATEGRLYATLIGFVGHDTAVQMQDIIKNAHIGDRSKAAAILGGFILLIGATSVFAEIQESINDIWGLKPKPKRGWVKFLENRFLSFSVIVSLAFLLLVSLVVSAVIETLSNRLQLAYPEVAVMVFYMLNLVVTFIITAVIFAVIFKVLPDATVHWRDVAIGSVVTASLFMIGRYAIGLYISGADVGDTFGAAGSIVVVLAWMYYSSMILYFGAEFTKAYALEYGEPIYPSKYAVTMQQVEVLTGAATIQDKEDQVDKVMEIDTMPVAPLKKPEEE
jgi:membrane protein